MAKAVAVADRNLRKTRLPFRSEPALLSAGLHLGLTLGQSDFVPPSCLWCDRSLVPRGDALRDRVLFGRNHRPAPSPSSGCPRRSVRSLARSAGVHWTPFLWFRSSGEGLESDKAVSVGALVLRALRFGGKRAYGLSRRSHIRAANPVGNEAAHNRRRIRGAAHFCEASGGIGHRRYAGRDEVYAPYPARFRQQAPARSGG